MTDIINEENNNQALPEEEVNIAVVDNGQTYESQESAIIARDEADRAKQWAEESERQANISTTAKNDAITAKNQAVSAKTTSIIYATLAQEWAVKMDGIVNNNDYSSKYYAQQAKAYAQSINPDNIVHKSGNETITGDKTFSGNIVKSMGVTNNGFKVQTTLNKGTPPTSDNAWGQFTFQDASGLVAGGRLGGVEVEYATNGSIIVQLEAFEPVLNSTNYEKIAVIYPASGSAYTYAPIPALASTASGYANQIVTVGYLDTGLSSTVKLTGNQTIDGEKTFSKAITTYTDTGTMFTLKCSGIDCSSYVSSTTNKYAGYFDDNGVYLGGVQLHYSAVDSAIRLQLRKQTDTTTGANSLPYLGLRCLTTGNAYGLAPDFLPISDNTYTLGNASYRWKQLFAGTTTISTSDERLKQGIESVPDEVLDAWGEVEFYRYKFNESVEEKGEAARYHLGMIAQRIMQVFGEHGLNARDYGLLCYDEWQAEPAEIDEDGQIVTPAREAGNRYSLRYEECLCMEAAYQRRRADRIEARLRVIEEKLDNLSNQKYNNAELTL